MNEPLSFGVYVATPEFKAIEKHSCVLFTETRGLVAATGPAGDAESERYAELFAAAPDLLAVAKTIIRYFERDNHPPHVEERLHGKGAWTFLTLKQIEAIRAIVSAAEGGPK